MQGNFGGSFVFQANFNKLRGLLMLSGAAGDPTMELCSMSMRWDALPNMREARLSRRAESCLGGCLHKLHKAAVDESFLEMVSGAVGRWVFGCFLVCRWKVCCVGTNRRQWRRAEKGNETYFGPKAHV